jgi:hypothetical protein
MFAMFYAGPRNGAVAKPMPSRRGHAGKR